MPFCKRRMFSKIFWRFELLGALKWLDMYTVHCWAEECWTFRAHCQQRVSSFEHDGDFVRMVDAAIVVCRQNGTEGWTFRTVHIVQEPTGSSVFPRHCNVETVNNILQMVIPASESQKKRNIYDSNEPHLLRYSDVACQTLQPATVPVSPFAIAKTITISIRTC